MCDGSASSPAARCVETVEPARVEQHGLEVERRDELFEGADIDAGVGRCSSTRLALDGDAVLCSHGDVIPDLIRRAQLRGMEVPGEVGLRQGLVLDPQHWDGERFAPAATSTQP